MSDLNFDIPVHYQHRIRFTRHAFSRENPTLAALLETGQPAKVIVFVENEIVKCFPQLEDDIRAYLETINAVSLATIMRAEGGEYCKRSEVVCREIMDGIEWHKIDRHSYVFAIGGGAFLDVVGFAAATAHRGIRLVRFPTTTLAQDDSGVGVKNGINLYKKKNFLGTFAVPYAVINDFTFLYTQSPATCREGLIEAVKVALVKDRSFFEWIEANLEKLRALEPATLEACVERSATLHAQHIALGGDPFELGSSRPLDYGHWSAHKAEQISDFRLTHAQAVSVGLALDSLYSAQQGYMEHSKAQRILKVIRGLQLPLWEEDFGTKNAAGKYVLFEGLEEFREHLGGTLTVLLLSDIGEGFDVHEMDEAVLTTCFEMLKNEARSEQYDLK